jgi:hypothetical protein
VRAHRAAPALRTLTAWALTIALKVLDWKLVEEKDVALLLRCAQNIRTHVPASAPIA